MDSRRPGVRARFGTALRARGLDWRAGTQGSQVLTLGLLLAGVTAALLVTLAHYDYMPLATYYLWLLLGMMLLRIRPLLVLTAYLLAVGVAVFVAAPFFSPARVTALVVLVISAGLVLVQAHRDRSGLPAALGAALLADLRDLLQEQSRVPPLPPGWTSESAMIAAHGVSYAGDFMVAELADDGRNLHMVLVDVCGKGISAGPRSLQLVGALGGLVGSVAPSDLLGATNRFLVRQDSLETFATAVQVSLDLGSGRYEVRNAGHPPALRWSGADRVWTVDGARGTALGVVDDPDLDISEGTLAPGDALMFYTDGVVESRGSDLDAGIAWLRETARVAVDRGFAGAAGRVVRQVSSGDDDRAVLIVRRLEAA